MILYSSSRHQTVIAQVEVCGKDGFMVDFGLQGAVSGHPNENSNSELTLP